MKIGRNTPTAAIAFSATVLAAGLATSTIAHPSRCLENGTVVTFDGVAARTPEGEPSQWLLSLSQPICVAQAPAGQREISTIRIIGTPPPLGIPLELTGKLLLGRSASESRMFVALVVKSGRKVMQPGSATRQAPRSPESKTAGRCDAPPYGGTMTDYQSFVGRFGRIIRPDKILGGICNAKFGGASRAGLHKLGFADAKIDSESTEHLAAETIVALKSLVNAVE